jgi:hypothetical protein
MAVSSNPLRSAKIYVSAITSGSAGERVESWPVYRGLCQRRICFDLRRQFAAHSPLPSVLASRSRLSVVRVPLTARSSGTIFGPYVSERGAPPPLRHPSRSSEPHVRLRTDHLYRRPPPALRGRNASGIETLSDLAQACPLGAQLSHDRSHVLGRHKSHPTACRCTGQLGLSSFPPLSTSTYSVINAHCSPGRSAARPLRKNIPGPLPHA